MSNTSFYCMLEHDEDDINPAPPQGMMVMSDNIARVIYFSLCNERDKVVKDIEKYHNLATTYYKECDNHGLKFDPWCEECIEVNTLREKGKKLEATRDEDLMFLGDYLNEITTVLYHMNADEEFSNWLSV